MKETVFLIKFTNGESKFFPDDIYSLEFDDRWCVVKHIKSDSVSLRALSSQILYVRENIPKDSMSKNKPNDK